MKRLIWSCGCLMLLGAVCSAEEVSNGISVGKPAPDFRVTGMDGQPLELSDKIAGGKNVVLMFSRAHW